MTVAHILHTSVILTAARARPEIGPCIHTSVALTPFYPILQPVPFRLNFQPLSWTSTWRISKTSSRKRAVTLSPHWGGSAWRRPIGCWWSRPVQRIVSLGYRRLSYRDRPSHCRRLYRIFPLLLRNQRTHYLVHDWARHLHG